MSLYHLHSIFDGVPTHMDWYIPSMYLLVPCTYRVHAIFWFSFGGLQREIMEDPFFKGNQKFHFEMDLDALGERMFGGEANAGVSFQIGQLRYVPLHDEYILVHTRYIPRA